MKKLTAFIILNCVLNLNAQKKPKLVVGIVVDQMRYDYLLRFKDKFGSKGFNKLINKGTNFENAHYNYIPTYTAVGHSSIYTGTTPKNHGIIGNNWYDKFEKKNIYVVNDLNYHTIGSESNGGKKSPKRLVSSTVADELKLAQNFKGKVFGVAIKDRSAILPAGHAADMAFWFDGGREGKWISSSYYADKLPEWVLNYNSKNKIQLDTYLNTPWTTKNDIETYEESANDLGKFERAFKQKKSPTFPYNLAQLKDRNGNYSLLKNTPAGNTITLDFAKEIIKNEQLGKDKKNADFLAISLSSTDYVGHQFGPASKEVQDTYLRLNDDIDAFINFLDNQVGKKNYVLFVTADHAVVNIPNYLKEKKIPGGYFNDRAFKENLKDFIAKKYQTRDLIENVSNNQIFLNHKKLDSLNLSSERVENDLIEEIINYPVIYKAVSAHTLQRAEFKYAPMSLLQEGYNQKRSGDILFMLTPSVIKGNSKVTKGTTHGTGYNNDTHIPIIFYGASISKGKKVKKPVTITQIAPTLSNLLQIQEPTMSCHDILTEIFTNP